MKKLSDTRHEAFASGRPSSAPNLRQRMKPDDLSRISETSVTVLITNAQATMATIHERRRKTSSLPRISPLSSSPTAVTSAPHDHGKIFSKLSASYSKDNIDTVVDETCINQTECLNFKLIDSSKKLRPISANVASRAPNSLTSLQPNDFTAALSVIRFFTLANASAPKIVLGGLMNSTNKFNHHVSFRKGDIISRLKRACSVISARPKEGLTLLRPILHQAGQDLERMQAPEMVLAAAIIVRCSEVRARIQELQDWFHNAITKIRKESSNFIQSDRLICECRAMFLEIQVLYENFSVAQSQSLSEQQCVEELRTAHSSIMMMEVQDSRTLFEASAVCSAPIHATALLLSELQLLQQETNSMFHSFSSSFVSSFLESCALFQSIADSSIRSIRTKSTVSMPLSPDDDKNLAKIEIFLEKCKNLPHDLSKFLFINDADKFAVARGFSEATSACTEFSQLCKQYAIVIENHEKNAFLKKSFEDFLHKHEFSDASNLLHQIEQNCSLISQESSNDLVFQCQTHFNSCKSLFEKDMIQVRDHIRLAQQSFARDRDDLQVVYGHIEAAQAAISNIRCDVPERTTLRLLVAKVKSAEARRYWHAKSSVQFGLSSVSETLTKCWEDSKNVAFLTENLAKLEATIESLRSIIDKFSIHDDDIINQVHALQGGIDDLNVLASGSRLEPLEITYSNCLQDFHKLVNESDELYQLEHGISLLKQIQCRLKRFLNRSFDKSSIESSLDMSDQCAREISRIELSRRKHLQQLNIEVADLKELLARSSAQDESDKIPKLHSRISYVRQVANAIDDQAALVEIVDLCRKCALVVEHRDNWLRSKVLVSLSEAESVFRNHRSEIPDLIAAIERLKDNHITVTMMMSSAVQVQTTSRIERTATHLKSCLILIQNDQQDKKEMLEALNSKLTLAIASYHDGVDDDASFSTMLDLQAQGIDLTPRIHIDAEISLKEFERLSLLVSKIHKRREQLSTMIADANSLCSKIDKWLSQTNCPPGDDSIEIDFKPLLLHLQKASIVIVGLHMFDTQDMRNLADRLQSLVSDVLLIAIDEMKKFLLNAHKDVLAIEHLLAANDFAPAVSIVDLLKDSIGYHQVTLLYLKFCSKTVFKFYKHKVAPFLASTRLLEFDLLTLIQHFDRSSHELPMLRAGVLAQGNALLNEAHMACVARKADIAREKLRLAILCLAKVCKPEQWQSVSENIKFLEHRCFSEAAASAALCKISQAHCKRHDYHVALTFLLSACEIVNRWNLNKITVVSTFEFVVSSSLEFLSGVCSASDEIWESFKRIIESGSACQGQNLISVVLGIVQHHKLIRDVMYSRLLGQESLVWDDILQREKPFRPNLWNSNMLQMSTKSIGMTKELMVIIESLEKKDEEMSQRSGQVLTSLSNSIQVSLYDSGFLSSARSRICDAIRERRLTDASCAVREVIVAVVTAGVSPDYMMSIYDRYKPLVDCIQELETSEPAFCIPYNGISLPHVKWLPPATVKLDVETSATVVANIADALNACLEVCCCALAEKDIQIMEFEMLSTENRKNIGFLYAAAALAPGAFFQVLSSRHSCHLDSFQTPDGLTLLHVAACYCNDQSLKVILENLSNPDLIFAVDCFGRNALHFVLGANRELAGVTESTMCSIFDSTYFKWVSLQECIAKFCPESRGVSTMGGFHEFSRHTPRHNRSNQDLDIVFRILQRDFSQHLERFTASDFALNNFMHYIARRSIKGHKASKHEHVETKTRSHRLFGNLHSNVELTRDQVVHQERGTRDLASLHQIFQIFQKPFCLTLLNDENIDGMTPLLLACSHGNSTVVALFILQLGADAACCDLLKRTPLHFAADHDDRHTFKLLLKCHGIDTSAVNIHGQTCLFRLICLGHEFLVSELMKVLSNTVGIQDSSKIDVRIRRRGSVNAISHHGKQASQSTDEMNQSRKLRFQQEKDNSNNSLLHAAAFSGSEVLCNELLAAGLAANKMNDLALTPLHIAAIRGHASCLNVLAKSLRDSSKHAHPDLDASVLQALLLLPEDQTCCDRLKTLILAVSQLSGVGIDEHLHDGNNLAHAAVFAERGDIVQALTELKAKSCVPTSGVTSVVHACAYFNRPKILSILCSKGVECISVDDCHRTPLHMCMLHGSTETAVALVQMRRYPVRAKDDFGLTAVNYLIVELLKSACIDRSSLKLDLSKHAALIKTVLAVVKICPEVLLDPLPCGISIFHLLATDSSSEVTEILQQLSAAVGEVIYAMPSNPFDARIIPVPVATTVINNQRSASVAASNNCSRGNNTIWMQPYLRPGDTPAMVAVRCCNTAALSVIARFASDLNKRCSGRSPLAQALQPRLQQQQKYCSEIAQVLLVHSSGGFCDLYDAKIVAAAVARHAGLYKNLLFKPSPLLEKLKSYKALTAPPCLQFKRNALCEIFRRQPLATVQQIVSVMHSGHFVQVNPEWVCDLNGNSLFHHIFMKNRSESHILGLWNLCLSVMESSAKEQLANLRNKRGKTLLHKVCRFCSVRTLQIVLRALSDHSIIDYAILFVVPKQSNCSPFSRALKYGNAVLVQYLLSLEMTSSLFQASDSVTLSQTFESLLGPKSSLQKLQTFSGRSACLDSLRNKLHPFAQLESMCLQEYYCFKISLKRCSIRSSKFQCASYDKTGFRAVSVHIDVKEISKMFECIPFKESGFPPRIQLPKIKTQCGQRQLKISQSWDKIFDLFSSMNDAISNFDSTALSFNSQKSLLQLSQLPDPSNVFILSIVWFNLSNVISNILCHHEAKLKSDIATFNFSDDFTQRLRFLIEVGQDAPSYCRPDANLIHRTLGMELDDVDIFIASQISINETAACVCANAASILQTLSVYIKCLEQAKDMFSNSSHFALERLSGLMNQENPTSESLLSACSKIPPLLYSHVQCCYLMSIANFALESIGLPEQLLNELLLESQKMQNAFKAVIPSELNSYGSWESVLPQTTDQNADKFYYIDIKSCVFYRNGLDFLKHLLCMSAPLNPRDLKATMMDLIYFLESKSPPTGVIESCISVLNSEETGKVFKSDDVQRISFLLASARQFESMKVIIEQTYSSLDTCELFLNCDLFYSASEILSSVKKCLEDHDIFARVIASKVSQLEISCAAGIQLKKDNCDMMLREATRVLADAAGLHSKFIHDLTHEDADVIKCSLMAVLLLCDACSNLIIKDTSIPHHHEPWCQVSITQEKLNSSLSSTLQIINDVQRIASSRELLRICRIFEGKGVSLLPSAVIELSLNPLNLGPLLPSISQAQVEKWLGQDVEFNELLSLNACSLNDWMAMSNQIAMDSKSTSDDLLACIPRLQPLKEKALGQLKHIIDVETFIRSGTVEVKTDCVDILKSYFVDSDSCDAIVNFVTKESSELYRVLQCIVDANAHRDNLVHLCKHFETLESVAASESIKSKILALNRIIETIVPREREEAAIKIQRIARGVLVRRMSRVEVASSISTSKEEFKWERQCSVRNAFASKIVNELLENVNKLKGLNDLKYKYDPSEWRAQYFRRCQAAITAENQRFNAFFSVCKKLDRDALTYEKLDESALRIAALDVQNIRLSYSEEDWIVARREFFVDIHTIESKLQAALLLCLHRGEESRCILKLRAAQGRVREALDAGNHLLALDDASSNWDIDPALSSSELVNYEVEVLRASVANSILTIAADRHHLEKLAQAYSKSLNNIIFHIEQSQYDNAHSCIVQAFSDIDEFKALADRVSGITVRNEDIPQVDFTAISRLQSTLLIVVERDKAIEQLEAQDSCIEGSYHLSYALINHVSSIIIKSDCNAHSVLSGPLFQIRDRVDDAVRLMFRELRRVASAIKMERIRHLDASLISIILSHRHFLEKISFALEYSTKVGRISIVELSRVLSSDFANESAQEIDPTWWTKVQKQLLDEVQLLDDLSSLHCQRLKEVPDALTQICDKYPSKYDFVRAASSFVLRHLVPLSKTSSEQLPLPSLIGHLDFKAIVSSLLAYIHSFISEFDVNCSVLISNIQQLSQLYRKSKEQLVSLIGKAVDGHWDLCTGDILSPIKDDFEKCELLVVRTLSLLDFFPPGPAGLPVRSEHLRWFKLNATSGSRAAEQCHSFIEKVTSAQEGLSMNANRNADVRAECLRLLANAQKSSDQLLQEPPSWPEEPLIQSKLLELRVFIDEAAQSLQSSLSSRE